MKRFSKKKSNKQQLNRSLHRISQQQEVFEKVSRTFTANYLRPSQHKKIVSTINYQIKRPETSKNVRRDYRNLMDLADCNKKIIQSRQRSIMSYKKMKSINKHTEQKNYYQPVLAEIYNTQANVYKKKYEKYDIKKFKQYLKQQKTYDNSIQQFVQSTIYQGIRDLKNQIPQQANLSKKLNIFGALPQQQKQKHLNQIKNIILKQKQRTPDMSVGYQIYLVNFYLMEKMMEKVCEDSSALEIKRKNSKVYSMIKNQMIGQIVNEKKFVDMLQAMEGYADSSKDSQNLQKNKQNLYNYHHKSKIKQKIKVGRHHRNDSDNQMQIISRQTSNKCKQNQIVLQFQKLYQQAQQKINQAQLQLSFPTARKNNFYSMIQMHE